MVRQNDRFLIQSHLVEDQLQVISPPLFLHLPPSLSPSPSTSPCPFSPSPSPSPHPSLCPSLCPSFSPSPLSSFPSPLPSPLPSPSLHCSLPYTLLFLCPHYKHTSFIFSLQHFLTTWTLHHRGRSRQGLILATDDVTLS